MVVSFGLCLWLSTGLAVAQSHECPVFDAHSHWGFAQDQAENVALDLEQLKLRGINGFAFPLPVDRSPVDNLLERIRNEVLQIRHLSEIHDGFHLLQTQAGMMRPFTPDGISAMLTIEYFDGVFNRNPDSVDAFAKLGVRAITLINNEKDPLYDEHQGGARLTNFGKQIIRRMNETRVLIDISHLNEDEQLATISFSKRPVLVSHGNARSVASGKGKLSDAVIEALEANQGMVMVSFNRGDLFSVDSPEKSGIEKWIDHVDFITKQLGMDRVGIGTDLQSEGQYVPADLSQKDSLEKLKNALSNRGYQESDICKLFASNLLNLLAD